MRTSYGVDMGIGVESRMISRCVVVPFPKILIFYSVYFQYANSSISFWPLIHWLFISLSVLPCIHFLPYEAWIHSSLFPPIYEHSNCLPHSPPIISVWWNIHQTTHFDCGNTTQTYSGHNTSNLQSQLNVGNLASSLSILAFLLHLDYPEISSLLFLVLSVYLTTYFTEKREIWKRIPLAFRLQSL